MSGLEHGGAAGGDCGRQLVSDEIERKIKWSDGSDRAQGIAAHNAPSSGSEWLQIERQPLSANARSFVSGDAKSKDRAVNLGARGLDGFAGLKSNAAGEFFVALADALRNIAQN